MNDPADSADQNVDAFTEFAIKSKRPTQAETEAF